MDEGAEAFHVRRTKLWVYQHVRSLDVNSPWLEPLGEFFPVDTLVLLFPCWVRDPIHLGPVVRKNHGVGATHGCRPKDVDAVGWGR